MTERTLQRPGIGGRESAVSWCLDSKNGTASSARVSLDGPTKPWDLRTSDLLLEFMRSLAWRHLQAPLERWPGTLRPSLPLQLQALQIRPHTRGTLRGSRVLWHSFQPNNMTGPGRPLRRNLILHLCELKLPMHEPGLAPSTGPLNTLCSFCEGLRHRNLQTLLLPGGFARMMRKDRCNKNQEAALAKRED